MPFSVFIPCKYLSADFVISNAKFFHFSRKATMEDLLSPKNIYYQPFKWVLKGKKVG